MRRFSLLGLILTFIVPHAAAACSIPVFRYALERWAPTPYDVLVFHRGKLTDSDNAKIKELERTAFHANIEVTEIDLDGKLDSGVKKIWEKHGGTSPLPWVIMRFPDSDVKSAPAWTGPLDVEQMKPLMDSAFRQQIAQRLFGGDSAVFVLLESGDEKADAEAARLLDTELPKLEKTVELPVLSPIGPQLRSELPLRVSFSYLKLSRKNPEEKAFIDLLLRCEEGLDTAKGPIVMTFFGRGRMLTALHGKDLQTKELEAVVRFLCGACSCQVKELNPGIDLLFNTRWDAFLEIEIAPNPRVATPSPKR